MRRDALDQLTALRARRDVPSLRRARKFAHFTGFRGQPALTVQVTAPEQITEQLLNMKPSLLYVPLHLLARDPKLCRELSRRVEVAAVLPRICHDSELDQLRIQMRAIREQGIKAVLVGNLGLLLPAREAGMRIHGDFGLNIYNSGAVNAARDLELASAMLSFEMTLPQIRDVSKAVPCEIFAYGRLPLMVTENCLIRGLSGDCTCHLGATRLMDKTGADFPVIKDGNSCRSVLLNGKKLYWLDRQDDLAKLGLWAVRLYFTTENAGEVDQVLNYSITPAPFNPGNYTRGLYLRGLD
jgi:putative protease